jgi:hypothetical protein
LIIVDGVFSGTRAAADLAVLARAAHSTRYFSVLAVGTSDLADELASVDLPSPVAVPRLHPMQVHRYLDGWLRATRHPDAPPLIITIDAALIIGHRSEGSLHRVNTLARRMITGGGPVLTSWDAWSIPNDIGHPAGRTGNPIRPAGWPTPDVLRLINQNRAVAGIAPRAPADEQTAG